MSIDLRKLDHTCRATRPAGRLPSAMHLNELLQEHSQLKTELLQLELELMSCGRSLSIGEGDASLAHSAYLEASRGNPEKVNSQTFSDIRLRALVAKLTYQYYSPGIAVAISRTSDQITLKLMMALFTKVEKVNGKLAEVEQAIGWEEPETLQDVHHLLRYIYEILTVSPEVDVDFVSWMIGGCMTATQNLLACTPEIQITNDTTELTLGTASCQISLPVPLVQPKKGSYRDRVALVR